MPEGARLVRLDEADATDPELVGAKAARLARARRQGLPVPDGLVVTVEASAAAVSQGEAVLSRSNNSGAARTAVFQHEPPRILSELARAAQDLGDRLVVRSSSRAEAEGVWAGAFSSYLDLRPEEVTTGVVGCWASIFNPDSLKRAEAIGVRPSDIGMAVLIQPQVHTVRGGVAALGGQGEVTVTSTPGHHGSMLAGRQAGEVAVVAGDVSNPRLLRQVSRLTKQVWERVRYRQIEWAEGDDGKLFLLQAQPEVVHQETPRPVFESARGRRPELRSLVQMMLRYPGPVGERWVWPWAIGLDLPHPDSVASSGRAPAVIAAEIRNHAAELFSQRRSDRRSSGRI